MREHRGGPAITSPSDPTPYPLDPRANAPSLCQPPITARRPVLGPFMWKLFQNVLLGSRFIFLVTGGAPGAREDDFAAGILLSSGWHFRKLIGGYNQKRHIQTDHADHNHVSYPKMPPNRRASILLCSLRHNDLGHLRRVMLLLFNLQMQTLPGASRSLTDRFTNGRSFAIM